MNDEQIAIWNFLTENAVGRNNALGLPPNGTNNDDVRRLITDMVMNRNRPIGSCSDGVFLFTNEEEREEAARFVERRTKAGVIRTINFYTPN